MRKDFRNNVFPDTIIMSANRSVAAAQRRRAGPPEPGPSSRGPQPSINSSQMFAQQQQGSRSAPVTGRLAGQHAAQVQKNMMSQEHSSTQGQNYTQGQSQSQNQLSGISRMTMPQAITLITLRLGKIETQLMNNPESNDGDNILVDSNIINSLISRIDALEKTPGSVKDIAVLKQQFDTIKPIAVQSKNSITALKQQIETLKTELNETKELVIVLQNLTMDNNTKIIALNSVFLEEGANGLDEDIEDIENIENVDDSASSDDSSDQIVGTDLKELIEQEFNLE